MRLSRYILPLAGALALAVCPPANAQSPSFLGSTGYGFTPSNDFLAARGFNGGLHMLFGDDTLRIYKANYGISNRLEAGVTLLDVGGSNEFSGKEVVLNARYLALPEPKHGFALSVGLFDGTDQLEVDPSAYVYASKDVTGWFGRHREPGSAGCIVLGVGFGTGIYGEGFLANGRVRVGRNMDLWAEYIDEPEEFFGDSALNVGARLRIGRRLSLDGGLFDIGDGDCFGAGLTWRSHLSMD